MSMMNKKDFFKAYQKSGLEPYSHSRSRDSNYSYLFCVNSVKCPSFGTKQRLQKQ